MYFRLLVFLLIGLLALNLASCLGKPRRYLAADASLVRPSMTRQELEGILGPPHARRSVSTEREEWYYYSVHRPFWQHIPVLGRNLGREEVEALQIVIEAEHVVKAVYYVPR